VRKNQRAGNLTFTTDLSKGVHLSSIVFIAVGTPARKNGEADLSSIIKVSEDLAHLINSYKIIAVKSTVPVGTFELITEILKEKGKQKGTDFDIASTPEFLREGNAVYDFFHPSRILIGADNPRVGRTLQELFSPLNAPILYTNPVTAQMTKYASNAFLASRISFINEIANICEKVGADVVEVARGMSYDKRIGEGYLNPGIGFGGPWQALKGLLYGKTVGILGLSFKAGTSDVRNSLSLKIIELLQKEGARIKVYDACPSHPYCLEGI